MLKVDHLTVTFIDQKPDFKLEASEVVHDMSFEVGKGEIFAVLGASGAGKSVLAEAIVGLLPHNAKLQGSIKLNDTELVGLAPWERHGLKLAYIPQSIKAMNPLLKIYDIVSMGSDSAERSDIENLFERFGLAPDVLDLYPHEVSGGMARRILAISSLIGNPDFVVADEPTPGMDTSALDVIVQVFDELKASGKSAFFISHDIRTTLRIADRIAVVNNGEIVEIAHANQFEGSGDKLKHPYTKALWRSLPENDFDKVENRNLDIPDFKDTEEVADGSRN